MKRVKYFYFPVFCMIMLLAACGKEKIETHIPLQDVTTEYETEGSVRAVAALDDDTVFALLASPGYYQLDRFDREGNWVESYDLDYVNIDSIIAAEDGKTIYFIGQGESISMSLIAFHTDTKQAEELCNFKREIARARKLVLLGDKMYVMGQKKMEGRTGGGQKDYDFSLGDTLLCCSMDDGQYSVLEFEYPINIADSGKGTLLVLAYFPDEGYCFVEYNPKNGSVKQKAKLDYYKFSDFTVCNDGNSILYDYGGNFKGVVLADFNNLDLEVEIYDNPSAQAFDGKVWYGNGRVYLQDNSSDKLVGFPLNAVQKKNKTIRFVSMQELHYTVPYGCGYTLERLEESWDKIALKMLAQDSDYDLCLGSSAYSEGLIMRNSNVLCSLNDLPGIEEYFDKCFPYIREAATTEAGEIWMLPVSASVYAMCVQEERAARQGLNLHNNMTLTEFTQLALGLSEREQKMFYVWPEKVSEDFLVRYFGNHTSVQDEIFLEYMEKLRILYQKENLLHSPGDVNQEILLCTIESIGKYPLSFHPLRTGFSIYSIPKEKDTAKNNVTLYYLAVNKKSKHKNEALSYLTDLIAYLIRRDDLLISKDYKAEPGSREEQLHALFENGDVYFAIDEDVYQKDYVDVLKSNQPLEEYAKEVERRLQLYLKE